MFVLTLDLREAAEDYQDITKEEIVVLQKPFDVIPVC